MTPFHICSVGRFNNLVDMVVYSFNVSYASQAWLTNNQAVYAPVHLPAPFTVARFMVSNGSNSTGNVDVGLYNSAGSLLISTGTTARSGTSVVQYIGVANQSFPAGHYFLALVASSTTGSFNRARTGDAEESRMCGVLRENLGSTVLPSTMTPAAYGSVVLFLYGFTQSDTV